MKVNRPFALIDLQWRELPLGTQYPSKKSFATTGYVESAGIGAIFSVYVVLLDGEPGAGKIQRVRVFALVDHMDERLPQPGERFVLTSGLRPVGDGIVRDRGEANPTA